MRYIPFNNLLMELVSEKHKAWHGNYIRLYCYNNQAFAIIYIPGHKVLMLDFANSNKDPTTTPPAPPALNILQLQLDDLRGTYYD